MFSSFGKKSSCCFSQKIIRHSGNSHSGFHFWRIKPVHFSIESWNGCGLWGRKWMEKCFFAARVGIFYLWQEWLTYFSSLSPLILPVNVYISRQGKHTSKTNESTWAKIIKIVFHDSWLYRMRLIFYFACHILLILPFFFQNKGTNSDFTTA